MGAMTAVRVTIRRTLPGSQTFAMNIVHPARLQVVTVAKTLGARVPGCRLVSACPTRQPVVVAATNGYFALTREHLDAGYNAWLLEETKQEPQDCLSQKEIDYEPRREYLETGQVPAHLLGPQNYTARKNWRQYNKAVFALNPEGTLLRNSYHKNSPKSFAKKMRHKIFPTQKECLDQVEGLALVQAMHDKYHDGHNRTEELISRRYSVPNLREKCIAAVRNCDTCKKHEATKKRVPTPIYTTGSMQLWMIDLTKMPMMSPDGFQYVVVMRDHFDKFVHTQALKDKSMESVAKFCIEIFGIFGCPARLHSDNGGEFCNVLMAYCLDSMGIKSSTSAPRNPQCQGLIEKTNNTLKTHILKLCEVGGYSESGQEWDWVQYLAQVTMHENTVGLKLYGGLNAFFCKNHRPGYSGECEPLDEDGKAELIAYMVKCQLGQGTHN